MNRDKIHDNDLLDYYGELLTQRQNEILGLYLEEDMTMAEIAERSKVSKTAVADMINRAYKQLDLYEEKLKLVELAHKRSYLIEKIKEKIDDPEIVRYIDRLEDLK